MKNITQYFVDTVKSNDSISIHSSDEVKEETECKKDSKRKRNRVKIKISRTNAKESVCDIIESSSDMIDKTPSPFAKVNNVSKNLHETPKRVSLSSSKKYNKLSDKSLALETNNLNIKDKKHNKKNNFKICLNNNNKKCKKELSSKTSIDHDVSIHGIIKNRTNTDNIDLLNVNCNNAIRSNREDSNAFQILMSRNKPVQFVSPTKFLLQSEDVNAKKSEKCKEKLKHSKAKLIALADKKGYSRRKLAEIEEGEKIERIIQNRMKFFKEGEKKDTPTTTVLSHKQPPGNLLNYFSKTPVDLTHADIANMSPIVVKADVHMTENSIIHNLHRSNSNNGIQSSKENKRSNLQFSEMDDISIIESENIDISNNKKKQQDKQHSKRKWALRIKLETYENASQDEDSDGDVELFSPRSTVKLNIEHSKQSETIKSKDLGHLSTKNKSRKEMSKQMNECMNLKLKKREQLENSEHNIIISDNKYLKTKPENKYELIEIDKRESTLVKNRKLNNCNNVNLGNIEENKLNQENCVIIDNNSKRKISDKLAPLFIKRRKPDPEVVAARRLFLQSDMTDNNSKSMNRKINVYGILPFPLISHITQSSNADWSGTDTFNISKDVHNEYVPIINVSNFKHLIDHSEIKLKMSEKVNKPKIQETLIEIEKRCSNIKKMWDVISVIVKKESNRATSPKTRNKKNKQLEKKKAMEYKNKEDQSEYYSWPYKYRPKSTQEIVGNEEAAAKLKEWLIGWEATFSNEDVNDEDEFYSSDSNYSRRKENNHVAVLLGPYGCGKTASVYAVAEEFGYTVLELNASSKRTGKKLLKELEEATKSHRIRKDEKASALCNSLLHEVAPKKISQNSLILIEDVDIIFDEDEGFISATYQLASNTKRPIVMTCRDICPHLNKMAPQQNRIYFKDAVGNSVSAFLELISLAETGYRLPFNYITELLNCGDLRKAILQLQYLLLSANKLDSIALLSSLIDIEDSALNLWQIKTQPNLSLIENTASYSASDNMCLDLAEWISNKVVYKNQLNKYINGKQYQDIILKKQLNKAVNFALSQTTSLLLDRQIIATDYLPSVRTICRVEESRVNTNNKRGNRFFHYLYNLKASSTLLKPNILTAACKIMYDKGDNDMHVNEQISS
ncbi:ATPase family AAA domain-containing protein 5 [Habropoda laboriosa]|uniref:ATPase family AAA domain-containing protein 5 n=1 Tax=Habropoda laboriosa TaxID=597456 RepID=A0A0L7R4R2_9HYME|nr:ATPase family AAA domain-containing protein 5 [Habropoda laboriosa]